MRFAGVRIMASLLPAVAAQLGQSAPTPLIYQGSYQCPYLILLFATNLHAGSPRVLSLSSTTLRLNSILNSVIIVIAVIIVLRWD